MIPAAGHSRRMGQPKLLLPVGPSTVIGRVITALQSSGIHSTAVVVRASDTGLRDALQTFGLDPVVPSTDPADMRASIEHGLRWIEQTQQPTENDAWLLLPADHPILDATLIQRVCDTWRSTRADVLIPTHQGRRGHPLIARWPTVAAVRALPADVGVNHWLRDPLTRVTEWPIDDPRILCDLDVPADYTRLLADLDA